MELLASRDVVVQPRRSSLYRLSANKFTGRCLTWFGFRCYPQQRYLGHLTGVEPAINPASMTF